MNGTIKPIPLKESEAREIQLLWGVMEILSETSPRLKKRLPGLRAVAAATRLCGMDGPHRRRCDGHHRAAKASEIYAEP